MDLQSIQLMELLGSILVICTALNTVLSFRNNSKKFIDEKNEPFARLEARVTEVERKLELDYKRFEEHEQVIQALKDGQVVTCKGMLAILNHSLHNGNEAEMESALSEMNAWLIKK